MYLDSIDRFLADNICNRYWLHVFHKELSADGFQQFGLHGIVQRLTEPASQYAFFQIENRFVYRLAFGYNFNLMAPGHKTQY